MNYRLFQYALPAASDLEDLNAFLRGQRVAAVSHHMVQTAGGAMLVFVVETVDSSAARPSVPSSPRIDYREELSPEEFAVFSRLRVERKKWSAEEGVPVYTIFTNAQLSGMIERRVRTADELNGIEGVGPSRVAKYGPRLLAILADLPPATPQPEKDS